ncbi:FtsX-like permease family protein, partial [Jatrophihabitans endophyticus]|uniref:FtsX-like permease family protein n=1 Tax=Jatrophihabitans endophyticus TaxID=1206085 RepID=UPI0019DD40D9
ANTPQSLAAVLHRLTSARRPEVAVHGSRLRLSIDLTQLPRKPVDLAVSITEPDREVVAKLIDHVVLGSSTRTVSLPDECAQTCWVTGLGFSARPPVPYSPDADTIKATLAASQYRGGHWQPVADFADGGLWRGDGKGQSSVKGSGGRLAVSVRQTMGGNPWPTLVPTAVPTAIPGAVGSTAASQYVGDQLHHLPVVGLDGGSADVDGLVRSVTLPRVDRRGVLVDLQTALVSMTDSVGLTTQFQVWLSPSAPSDMVARLEREHVRVLQVHRAATVRASLDDSGSAFADALFLVAALAATVLAIGATAAGRVLSTKRRSYELAALEAVGVSARTLRRATALEQSMVLVVGLLVGLVTGLVGSRLALPSTPVFADTSTGPPLVFGLPWALLGALAAGLVVVFALVSVAIAALVERSATPGQLRGAQQ